MSVTYEQFLKWEREALEYAEANAKYALDVVPLSSKKFAELAYEAGVNKMRDTMKTMAPTIAEAAKQGDSVLHVVEMCADAAAFNALKD